MSKTTTNYELIKPELADVADITAFNKNWDVLDSELLKIENHIDEVDTKVKSSIIHCTASVLSDYNGSEYYFNITSDDLYSLKHDTDEHIVYVTLTDDIGVDYIGSWYINCCESILSPSNYTLKWHNGTDWVNAFCNERQIMKTGQLLILAVKGAGNGMWYEYVRWLNPPK